MTVADAFLVRLDAVEERLGSHAKRDFPAGALTAPDLPSGERWEAGQVWAHMAEFIPYWLTEVGTVVTHGDGGPVAFGRTKSDPVRIAAIESDRRTDRAALWIRIVAGIAALRAFLGVAATGAWKARGRHPTLGDMDLATILDEFLVGHLEQHAEQLDGLTG